MNTLLYIQLSIKPLSIYTIKTLNYIPSHILKTFPINSYIYRNPKRPSTTLCSSHTLLPIKDILFIHPPQRRNRVAHSIWIHLWSYSHLHLHHIHFSPDTLLFIILCATSRETKWHIDIVKHIRCLTKPIKSSAQSHQGWLRHKSDGIENCIFWDYSLTLVTYS